jgi:hypothetical protein
MYVIESLPTTTPSFTYYLLIIVSTTVATVSTEYSATPAHDLMLVLCLLHAYEP